MLELFHRVNGDKEYIEEEYSNKEDFNETGDKEDFNEIFPFDKSFVQSSFVNLYEFEEEEPILLSRNQLH